jgi:HK97 family phage major capsid protein
VWSRRAFRAAALKNFKGEGAVERAFKFGQFALAAIFGNEKAAEWCKQNGLALVKAQNEGTATQGGFLVPEEVSMDIIVLRDSYSLARRVCKVWPMGRDTMTVPKLTSGLTAYAVGEASTDSPSAITASTAAWGRVGLVARKWGVLTYLSPELDEDAAVNIGDILAGEIAYAFAKSEDTALFSGDGTSTYHGIQGLRTIFNAGVGSLKGSVDAASGHDTMAEIDAVDLAAVQGRLPQYVYERGDPRWYCSQTMWANVFERLIGASGGVTKDQASGRTLREYNGYPVEITPAMLAPAAPTRTLPMSP